MTKFIVEPNPSVVISDAEIADLPLSNFHIVAVVEPDPESWMAHQKDEEKLSELLGIYCDLIDGELFKDSELNSVLAQTAAFSSGVIEPRVIWVGGLESHFFEPISYWSSVIFNDYYEELEDLRYYVRGVADEHQNWRAAVIGAMYEDEVMRVANMFEESGLDVIVLTRYCLSRQSFINLDDLFDEISAIRRKYSPGEP